MNLSVDPAVFGLDEDPTPLKSNATASAFGAYAGATSSFGALAKSGGSSTSPFSQQASDWGKAAKSRTTITSLKTYTTDDLRVSSENEDMDCD